jgi:DNA segregation ATPase FtsK/SpoIIIE, S-DNA-T family
VTDAPTPPATRASRCWSLTGFEGSLDVEVVAADDAPLGAVRRELSRLLGRTAPPLWAGSDELPDDLLLGAPALAHGAVLGLGRPGPRSQRTSALELHVVGGPEAGRTLPLGQGTHLLGRGAEATIPLADPDVSRRHALLRVGNGQLTVADLGSSNGSRLDGVPLGARPAGWPVGAVLRAGSSALTVRGPGGRSAVLEPGPGGRARLRPPARMPPPRPEVEVEFPREPTPLPRRRLAWVAIALPAVAGLAMAWLLRAPQFLFFGLLSPVVGLGTWLSERWTGGREGRRAAAAHVAAVAAAEARLAAALRADRRAAEAASPDLAALATAARRRSGRLWERRRGDADALAVRVGSGPGPSGVTRVPPEGPPVREVGQDLPVVVDLRAGGLGVAGPRPRAVGALAAAVLQVTALHAPGEVDLVALVRPDRLADWSWVRWLPHLRADGVRLRADTGGEDLRRWVAAELAARQAAAGVPGSLPWLVVLVDCPVDPRTAAALRDARDLGVVVLTSADTAEQLPVATDAVLRLAGETGDTAVLSRTGRPDVAPVTVDRLPADTARAFAADLAGLAPAESAGALPRQVRLLDLPAEGLRLADDDRIEGRWTRSRDTLVATLGRTADGPARVDLCRAGPHALVAGTTGSGKSELLQTLIASLALAHPPDRCSFLLVDYKGGAAFAEAAALPHTVGLLTDLDGPATERALRSLRAELTRREALLAAHRVADLAALPERVDLARLVIVVDEFATLAEELPEFVPGLVGIAQRGRSLGVHLVLATQRPGGVVSPEIRANCTLRLCLRTTDDADSRDVLGSAAAAALPVDLPGRAFLRTGTATPVALQVARVSTPVPAGGDEIEVHRWSWPLPRPAAAGAARTGGTDLSRLAVALGRHATVTGVPAPHRPWQPPLPDRLPAEDLDAASSTAPHRLRIGLVDHPDDQAREPLELDLGEAGGWLAVGGARSGRTTLLRTVLREAVSRLRPAELHVHVLDHGGGALAVEAAGMAHTGTAVGADDAHRTVRLVERLAEEVAARRSGAAGARPALLLLVDGLDAVCVQLDEADPGRGSATLLRLVRDGAAAGLTCVLTADRAVPGGRLAAVAGQRLVLPLPDRADYAVAGVPARAVPSRRPPGRALLGETALECQLALPRAVPALAGGPGEGGGRRLRIAELAADPVLPPPRPAGDTASLELPVGPGGDEGEVLSVDLRRTGGLLVVGPPGSGRSAALAAFTAHLSAAGADVLRLGSGVPPAGDGSPALDPRDAGAEAALTAWLSERRGPARVLVVDDAGALADAPLLTRLPPGHDGGPAVLAAGTAADLARSFQGPLAALRRSRGGLLLCPGPGDADLLGIRLPRTGGPVRPGSGWLVTAGVPQRVQVARRREPA